MAIVWCGSKGLTASWDRDSTRANELEQIHIVDLFRDLPTAIVEKKKRREGRAHVLCQRGCPPLQWKTEHEGVGRKKKRDAYKSQIDDVIFLFLLFLSRRLFLKLTVVDAISRVCSSFHSPPFVVVVVPLFITCFFWLSRRQFYTIVPVAMVAQSAATVRNLRWTRLTGGLDATQWIKKRRGELFGPITTNRWLRKRRQIKKRLCATLELLKRKNNKYFKSNRI